MKNILAGLILLLSLNSCSSVVNISSLTHSQSYCQPQSYLDSDHLIRVGDSFLDNYAAKNISLSRHDLYTANALGIFQELIQLDSCKKSQLTSKEFLIQLRLNIVEKIQKANEEIDGLAATLDCEGERTDQIANYLDQFNSKRNNRVTIASIIMGSLTTIATVAIDKNSVQNTVAIGGGILSSGLAAMTINPSGKKVKWELNPNLLEAIWFDDNKDRMIPESIWYMLNKNVFSNSQKNTLIESIKTRWLHFNFQEEITKEDTKRFFQAGGIYAADDLHLRANMINELQATIRTLHQDISSLTYTLSLLTNN